MTCTMCDHLRTKLEGNTWDARISSYRVGYDGRTRSTLNAAFRHTAAEQCDFVACRSHYKGRCTLYDTTQSYGYPARIRMGLCGRVGICTPVRMTRSRVRTGQTYTGLNYMYFARSNRQNIVLVVDCTFVEQGK